MRTQYDGINADATIMHRDFPDAQMIAYYLDGTYAWTPEQAALWPESTERVTITVRASSIAGDVLDVENGDATPDQAGPWITARKAAGLYRPTIYCSLSTVDAIRTATGSHIMGRDYDIWVAEFNGSVTPPPVPGSPPAQYAAKQYLATADYDVSAVYDDGWPHRKPPLFPAPALGVTWWEYANMSWKAEPGLTYDLQIRDPAGLVTTDPLPAGTTHWQTVSLAPGSAIRMRAVGGEWTEWRSA